MAFLTPQRSQKIQFRRFHRDQKYDSYLFSFKTNMGISFSMMT